MSTKYNITVSKIDDVTGVTLKFTYPIFPGHVEFNIYLQRSISSDLAVNGNWPLKPYFTSSTVAAPPPAQESGWETIKTWFIPEGTTKPQQYTDPIGRPTQNTYYRLILYSNHESATDYIEYDWAPVPALAPPSNAPGDITSSVPYGTLVNSVSSDSSGNYVICGYFSGTVDFRGGQVLTSTGYQDLYFAKYNISGARQFIKHYGGSSTCLIQPKSVALAPDGSIFVGGQYLDQSGGTANFGGPTNYPGGNNIFGFLVKYDSSGNWVWDFTFGVAPPASISNLVKKIFATSTSDVVMLGEFAKTQNFGTAGKSVELISAYSSIDVVIAKLRGSDGSAVASGYFASSLENFGADETAGGIMVDSSNNIYFVLKVLSAVVVGGVAYNQTGLLVKYSSTGGFLNALKLGFDYTIASLTGVSVDSDGNIYVLGVNPFSTNLGGPLLNSVGSFLVKYNSNFEFQWQISFGGSQTIQAGAIAIDSQNNVFVTGSFSLNMTISSQSPGNPKTLSAGTNSQNPDGFIARFNSSGVLQWAKNYGLTTTGDALFDIAIGPNPTLIAGGVIAISSGDLKSAIIVNK